MLPIMHCCLEKSPNVQIIAHEDAAWIFGMKWVFFSIYCKLASFRLDNSFSSSFSHCIFVNWTAVPVSTKVEAHISCCKDMFDQELFENLVNQMSSDSRLNHWSSLAFAFIEWQHCSASFCGDSYGRNIAS